jgi:hypothetical protein
LKLDQRPTREVEAREVTEGEVCNDAEMEVTTDDGEEILRGQGECL